VKDVYSQFSQDQLQQFYTSRRTIVKVANAMCDSLKTETFCKLRKSLFSLALDESSDIYGNSYLAVSARILELNNLDKTSTKLISIIPMQDSSTGAVLYDKVKSSILLDAEIERNLMGIVTDDGG
jgi:hypothetical protein